MGAALGGAVPLAWSRPGALITAQLVSPSLLPSCAGRQRSLVRGSPSSRDLVPPKHGKRRGQMVFIIQAIRGNKRARLNHSRGINR